MPEPKREEENILSFDNDREQKDVGTAQRLRARTPILPVPPLEVRRARSRRLLSFARRRKIYCRRWSAGRRILRIFARGRTATVAKKARRGVERLILDLIPVLDGFDRALRAHDDPSYEEYRKGVTLIRKQLWDVWPRHGLQRM